jgi:signal transduction histidine kinase
VRLELPDLARDLLHLQRAISSRFQQSSLFLESLLRRSHFEKGNYDLQLKPCEFKSQILEPQIERFRSMFQYQDIRIEVDPEVRIDEDVQLEADVGLMAQVFANLLANALKYTRPMPGPGGAPVRLMRYGWENLPGAFGRGKPGIRLFVATSGPEVPSGERSRLFEEGFRSAGTEAVGGSGHGLCFVRQIVELHKGRVDYAYESPMNVFSIILPRRHDPKRPEA